MASEDDLFTPILELDELVEIFGYTNERAARRAIRLEIFPIPTFELAGRTVAHVDVLKKFFDEKYDQGVSQMKRRYDPQDEQPPG